MEAKNTVDELIDLLKKKCNDIFNSHENNDTIYISACNAIENSLRYYLGNQSRSIDFKRMKLIAMIENVASSKHFPKDFIGFFHTVRIKSNTRHENMEAANRDDLLILQLQFYKYIKWFVCRYLKREEIEFAKIWHDKHSIENKPSQTSEGPVSKPTEHGRVIRKVLRIVKTGEVIRKIESTKENSSTEAKTTIRLVNVANKLNVGMAHVVDLLITKGFEVEGKPTEKITEEMYQVLVKEYQMSAEQIFSWGLRLGKLAESKKGGDATSLYNQACDKFNKAVALKPDFHEAISNWGYYLGILAQLKNPKGRRRIIFCPSNIEQIFQKTCNIKLADSVSFKKFFFTIDKLKRENEVEVLYRESFRKFEKAVEIKPDDYLTFRYWGEYLAKLAQIRKEQEGQALRWNLFEDKAEDLYKQSFEKFNKAAKIKPYDYLTFRHWGEYLGELAQIKKEQKADDFAEHLYREAFGKFEKTVEIKPDDYLTFRYWGNYLGELAQTKEGEEAEVLYKEAFNKYQAAVEIEPYGYYTFYYWGIRLIELAQAKEEKEKDALYMQAFEKFKKAVKIKPDWLIFYWWGKYLGDMAGTKKGKKADELYKQAFAKFKESRKIGLSKTKQIFHIWGDYLWELARTKKGKEAEKLYKEALEKYGRGTKVWLDGALGHKQLEEGPWDAFEKIFPVGSVHDGTIVKKEENGGIVLLPYGLEGFVPIIHPRKEDGEFGEANNVLQLKVIEIDREGKKIILSHSKTYD